MSICNINQSRKATVPSKTRVITGSRSTLSPYNPAIFGKNCILVQSQSQTQHYMITQAKGNSSVQVRTNVPRYSPPLNMKYWLISGAISSHRQYKVRSESRSRYLKLWVCESTKSARGWKRETSCWRSSTDSKCHECWELATTLCCKCPGRLRSPSKKGWKETNKSEKR